MSVILDALKRVQDESRRRSAREQNPDVERPDDDAMLRRLQGGSRPARLRGRISPAVWVAVAGVAVLALVLAGFWWLVPSVQPSRNVDQRPLLADVDSSSSSSSASSSGSGPGGEGNGSAERGAASTATEGSTQEDFLGDVSREMRGGSDPGATVGAVPTGSSSEAPSRDGGGSGSAEGQPDLSDLSGGVADDDARRSGRADRGEPGYLADDDRDGERRARDDRVRDDSTSSVPAPELPASTGSGTGSGASETADSGGYIRVSSEGEPGELERRIARDQEEASGSSARSSTDRASSSPSPGPASRAGESRSGTSARRGGARLTDPTLETAFRDGVRAQKTGDLQSAEAAYRRALEVDPKNAQVNANLGVVYQKQGKLALAEQHLRRAVETEPDRASTHNNLGVVLYRKRNFEGALLQFKQALARDPNLLDAYTNMGLIYTRWGEHDKAEDAFVNALSIDPQHALSHYNLGLVYEEKGETSKAISRYRAFLEFGGSEYPELVEYLGPRLRWLETKATGAPGGSSGRR